MFTAQVESVDWVSLSELWPYRAMQSNIYVHKVDFELFFIQDIEVVPHIQDHPTNLKEYQQH